MDKTLVEQLKARRDEIERLQNELTKAQAATHYAAGKMIQEENDYLRNQLAASVSLSADAPEFARAIEQTEDYLTSTSSGSPADTAFSGTRKLVDEIERLYVAWNNGEDKRGYALAWHNLAIVIVENWPTLRDALQTAPKPDNPNDVAPNAERERTVRECAQAVPKNWTDPLLSGPNSALPGNGGTWGYREIEALLRGIQDRIQALAQQPEPKE